MVAAFAFRPESGLEPDFSGPELAIGEALHIDVHSHIVPGVDDGSSTLKNPSN